MPPENSENIDKKSASEEPESKINFYKLEDIFEELYRKQKAGEKSPEKNLNFFRKEIAFHNIEKETEIPIERIRTLYKVYCSHEKEAKFKFWGKVRNFELGCSIFAAGVVGGIALLATAISFFFTLQQFNNQFLKSNELKDAENKIERDKSVTAAWKTLSEYSGEKANYGRSEALERLASENISLDGIDVAGANLNRLDLSPKNLKKVAEENQSDIDKSSWLSWQWMTKLFNQDTEPDESEVEDIFASVERADFRGAQLQSSNLTDVVFLGTDFSPYFRDETSKDSLQTAGAEGNSTSAESPEEPPSEDQGASDDCKIPEPATNVKQPTDREKTNLTNAVLVEADFSNARLDYAVLTNADFTNANLNETTLRHAEVLGTNFSGIDTTTRPDCLETLANQLLGRDSADKDPNPDVEVSNWRRAIYPYALREQKGMCGEVLFAIDKKYSSEPEKDQSDSKETSLISNVVLIPESIENRLEDSLSEEQTTNLITVKDLKHYFESGPKDNENRTDLRCYGFEHFTKNGPNQLAYIDLSDESQAPMNDAERLGQPRTLTDVNFSGSNLKNMDFSGLELNNINLDQTELINADLSGTILKNVSLKDVDLTRANLKDTRVEKLVLTNTNIYYTNLTGIKVTKDERQSILRYLDPSDQDDPANDAADSSQSEKPPITLKNWRLALYDPVARGHEELCGQVDFVLQETTDQQSSVVGHIPGKNNFSKDKFREYLTSPLARYEGRLDLSCYRFKEFKGTDFFVGQDLTGAVFEKSILESINLSQTVLKNANLSSVNLSKANLSKANLTDADLSDADLSFSNLSGADLQGARLNDETNLYYANLLGIPLEETALDELVAEIINAKNKFYAVYSPNLRKHDDLCDKVHFLVHQGEGPETPVEGHAPDKVSAEKFQAYLQALAQKESLDLSCFSFTKFAGAENADYFAEQNLSAANLSQSNLQGVDFSTADLSDANLWQSDLEGANLSQVKGLEVWQVANACNIEKATFSETFQTQLTSFVNAQKKVGKLLPYQSESCR